MAHLCNLYLKEPSSFESNELPADLDTLVSTRKELHDFIEKTLQEYLIANNKAEMKLWLLETVSEFLV
jgi:hypothetical protein